MSFWKRWSADATDERIERELKTARTKADLAEREAGRLKTLNRDMDGQVRDLLKASPMTEEQLAEIALVRKDRDEMRRDQNAVVVYLRTRFPSDFQSGRHAGRNFGEIVIFYLSRLLSESEMREEAPRAAAQRPS
jgi:hypothetical protein